MNQTTLRPLPNRTRGSRTKRRSNGRRRRRIVALMVIFAPAALITFGVVAIIRSFHAPAPMVTACTISSDGQVAFQLTPEQAQNAAIIAAVAYKDGLPDHAVTVALATAMQESQLVNLTYGDRDSVGLFQQRPSQGWGTEAEILNPVYAATAFYNRLIQVPGWATMPVTEAAQSVQISADPTAYASWEAEARALAEALTGETPNTFSCQLTSFSGPLPTAAALPAAAQNELGSSLLLGQTVSRKVGWTVASWAVAHAWQYHLAEVTFAGWTWEAATGKWSDKGPLVSAVGVVYSPR